MVRILIAALVFTCFAEGVGAYSTTSYYRRHSTTGYYQHPDTGSTSQPVQTNYQTLHGKTGRVREYSNYNYYPEILYYHIDNPNNDPIVIHFQRFSYRDCYNCSCESLTFYPRDWPYDQKALSFCGHTMPGNGHLYLPSLGTIASKKERYSSSGVSFDYEIISSAQTTTTYYYPYWTSPKPFIAKSRLLEIILNMQHQLDALSEEAKLAYNLVNGSQINNFARRNLKIDVTVDPQDGNSNRTSADKN